MYKPRCRAKDLRGTWRYGWYWENGAGKSYILSTDSNEQPPIKRTYVVNPETVGVDTDMSVYNMQTGEEEIIFTDDVLTYIGFDGEQGFCRVIYHDGAYMFEGYVNGHPVYDCYLSDVIDNPSHLVIAGNIFDNPELLEKVRRE